MDVATLTNKIGTVAFGVSQTGSDFADVCFSIDLVGASVR